MINASALSLQRGGKTLLEDCQFAVFPGHKVGIVGRNGTGKSSLFALLKGEISSDQGTLQFPADWRLASVAQETPALDQAAIEYVIDGDAPFRDIQRQLAIAEAENDGAKVGELHGEMDAIGGYQIQARAASLMAGLGFTSEQLSTPVSAFSGGWRMRLNLAQALISRADLLLLDEPTNHLDVDAIYWLESWLKSFAGTVMVISHDRDFLDNVVGQILHLSHHQLTSYSGGYSAFEAQYAEQLAQQQSAYQKAQAMRQHLQSYVDRFRYKASKARQAQSRLKAIERLNVQAPIAAESGLQFQFRAADQLPNPLMQLRDVKVGYGDTTILHQIKLNLVPGTRMGLLGKNGAGKSTLIKLLAQQLAPQAGECVPSKGLKLGYFSQHQLEILDMQASPLQHVRRLDSQLSEQAGRDYLGQFGFSGEMATGSIAHFSGGEKARLALALVVYQKPNLLLLDEPTNHLDLSMREALIHALQSYEGALILVSHDRHLLRTCVDEFYRVADGTVEYFDGDLDAYQQWLQQPISTPSEAPTEASPKTDRKAQKRLEAEFRKKTQPLRRQATEQEQQMARLAEALQTVETELADQSIYHSDQKPRLQRTLEQQRSLQQALAEAEEQWLAAEERLQEMQAEFESQQ
ncbi:ABC transporter ATP-binding protein [Idiomarina tyrosinivorans]|uniref:Probable ATP-binding protein YheS n=1 Tax=Idiomarina tyrosinivorans TaxID=1445662 RepID=A0A432ZQK8_9GAMM|nr:ATP-binding cassette domain-containing protein [Idiomarina tyrosinivorans]RUO80189.1 ABC transporter ATP-binding protein [Idiomarina tyrosinivorans]